MLPARGRRSARQPTRGRARRRNLREGAGLRRGEAGEQRDRGSHVSRPAGTGRDGRDRVVLFEGCYHGHSDGLLAGGGSGVATLGLPASAGVPKGSVAETLVAPYNVVPELGTDVAAVIVEPIAANMGLVPPGPGFLESLREACTKVGALLIFDEVITGFRVGLGGASTLFGVVPDLWCFGKVVGGGLPLAAFGGRRAVMDELAPAGPFTRPGRCRVTLLRPQPASRAFPCSMPATTRNWQRLRAGSARGRIRRSRGRVGSCRYRWLGRWSGCSLGAPL